ncbi:MAG: hypothetical protein KDE55_13220 [Novosphingobium sp.]|nr:hypothetical protein [Novosphingobium sp.]
MTEIAAPGQLAQLAAWSAFGLALGLTVFATLRQTVALYAAQRALAAGVLHAARIALIIGGLAVAVHFGAAPLLASALGLLVGRWLIVRRAGRDLS